MARPDGGTGTARALHRGGLGARGRCLQSPLLPNLLSACLAGAARRHGRGPLVWRPDPAEQNYLANIPGLPDS